MRWVVSVCLAWAAAMALEVPAAEPCTLRVGWEPYAPFTFADENGEATGADIDLITAVADAIGCAIVPVELPWARILKEVEQGTLDVSTSTSRTPEREQWALFSQALSRDGDRHLCPPRRDSSASPCRSSPTFPSSSFGSA